MNTHNRPHDTALAVQFSLSALRRVLNATGAFDGETGDELHGLLALMSDATGRLADQLDPAFVSIASRSDDAQTARANRPRRLRIVYSRVDQAAAS